MKTKKKTATVDREVNDLEELVGKKYFFRTVTYHVLGRVKRVFARHFLELEEDSWIADSGRFYNALKDGMLSEIEPAGSAREGFVNMDTVVDFYPWNHELPKEQK